MKRNVNYEVYRFYDKDAPSVFHLTITTKGIVRCLRKMRGYELDITGYGTLPGDVLAEGEEITKEQYDAYKVK